MKYELINALVTPFDDNNQIDCDEEYTNKLKNEILLNKEYQKILRKGAEKVENWKD